MKKLKLYVVLLNIMAYCHLFSQSANSIQFSSNPFIQKSATSNSFSWGSAIYGKLTTEKPLKNYVKKLDSYDLSNIDDKEKYATALSFMVCPKTEEINDRTYQLIRLVIPQQDLESKSIAFDVMPSEENASSFFLTGFYSELAKSKLIKYDPSEGTSSGEKIEFDIYMFEKELGYTEKEVIQNGAVKIANQVFLYLGKLTIDYSSVTDVREVMEWHDKCRAITEAVAEKYHNK